LKSNCLQASAEALTQKDANNIFSQISANFPPTLTLFNITGNYLPSGWRARLPKITVSEFEMYDTFLDLLSLKKYLVKDARTEKETGTLYLLTDQSNIHARILIQSPGDNGQYMLRHTHLTSPDNTQIKISTRDWNPTEIFASFSYYGMSFKITEEQIQKLLDIIARDQQRAEKGELTYSTTSMSDPNKLSCISWARTRLGEIGIQVSDATFLGKSLLQRLGFM